MFIAFIMLFNRSAHSADRGLTGCVTDGVAGWRVGGPVPKVYATGPNTQLVFFGSLCVAFGKVRLLISVAHKGFVVTWSIFVVVGKVRLFIFVPHKGFVVCLVPLWPPGGDFRHPRGHFWSPRGPKSELSQTMSQAAWSQNRDFDLDVLQKPKGALEATKTTVHRPVSEGRNSK